MRFMLPAFTFSIILALLFLAAVSVAVIVAAVRTGGRREETADAEALPASRFTIPVSVIVPARVGDETIGASIASILALDYPEFEVIVVADCDASAPQLDWPRTLVREWHLEAREFF